MLIPTPTQFRKRRGRPKRTEATPAPPIEGNVIVQVQHGGPHGDDAILVTINGTVTAIDEYGFALQVRTGIGPWIAPIGGNFDMQPTVFFLFPVNVDETTEWRVVDPTTWHFAGGGNLEEPYEGGIG